MTQMTYMEALRDGMRVAMRSDPNVFLAGEDVGAFGGCFGQTKGLYEEFGPKRVVDTPISETAIMGLATGAAAVGLRPIVEIMFVDFMGVCMDELFNNAAKMHYMFGGKITVPLVVRAPCGAGFSAAAQHSQSLDAWFAHIPGIKVVAPATPADAKGLMLAAIRDNNPVIYLEHKGLFGLSGEVPDGDWEVPLGKAEIKRPGRDVTIITWSAMVGKALEAAERLAADGIEAEVLDLRTITPLDVDAILDSVGRTSRAVIVHEEVRTAGFGGEVAAVIADRGFNLLDAPIKRVTAPDTPVPFSPVLEAMFIPQAADITRAVKELF
ncbi:alpha-ketoacid dehydrogenase subunit beta [Siculibacillus lacustris]|uniref:Alpha-ketoacid dehydrogenase subunit beta n=1 Tax=Siculibacillus lacustris TaxID=1549641 RepID=A0A4Q9VCS2_9HYPH|nr:alpha-ketoacid dehydrogenase subunit beta [Siculibacillus lacustris]TBW32173.1 alpha-ketoacid dehydrogenase subunit beta [Siculibacillus lacustris]